MSILIKGIDLPKDKDRIYLLIEGDKCFNALDPLQTLAEAIQIPTPHGRLIDASKVFCYSFWDEQNIKSTPTILEEEK